MTAPFGAGCYELRRKGTGEKLLFGSSSHVAARMTSLLPAPLGWGMRRNSQKRKYVLEYLADIQYRTIAFETRGEALRFERELKLEDGPYLFSS